MGKAEAFAIIQGFQGELSLSCEDIRKIGKNEAFLQEVADAIDEYMENNDLYILPLGKHDTHTGAIIEIINEKLAY